MKALLLTLIPILLAACNQQSPQNGMAQSSHKTPQAQKKYAGKPHAAIDMAYKLLDPAILNQPLQIELLLTPGLDTDLMEVSYHVDSGLQSMDARQSFQFIRLQKGSTQKLIIQLRPQQSGQQYINISVSIQLQGAQQSRAFSIPVQVQAAKTDSNSMPPVVKPAQLKNGHGMTHDPEQNVISMPARE